MQYYRNMRPGPDGKVPFRWSSAGFNAGAFFGGPVWFFYRKLWAWAWGICGLIVVLGLLPLPRGVGVGLGVGLAVAANRLYVGHAIGRLTRLRSVNGVLDPAAVRQRRWGVAHRRLDQRDHLRCVNDHRHSVAGVCGESWWGDAAVK